MTRSPATPLPPPSERRRLREAASLTRTQLAARLGVPRDTVRSWETGRTKPRGREREAYAEALDCLAAEAAEAAASVRVPVPYGDHPEAGAPPAEPLTAGPPSAAPGTDTAPDSAPEVGTEVGTETGLDIGPDAGPGAGPDIGPDAGPEMGPAVRRDAGPDIGPGSDDRGFPDSVLSAPFSDPLPDVLAHPGPTAPDTCTAPARTPAQAFDALYTCCAPSLARQAYLLTGRRDLARESVERAFQVAWERWPEVARDRDPAGWVRATTYEYALSPWQRFRPRLRRHGPPPAGPSARSLLDALLTLPRPYRRTLLLYDGVGLALPETAAETEATSPAAANRLLHAREAVAARLPELSDPDALRHRLADLASAERLRAAKPQTVRRTSERRARFWTRAAIAFTAALIGTTALTLRSAPTRYEPPVPPGSTVGGIPPRIAPGPLSDAELRLRGELRKQLTSGPERLVPLPG
ncbi:helix-turn-helix domain-containing protein [Streptomyces sp. NPDC005925]|uniref:helix-turn-helix domain-containing protein n=1 Tax=Streptomyces sp. NPDC005925 TaxID=3157172 RepID=UPI0034109D6D